MHQCNTHLRIHATPSAICNTSEEQQSTIKDPRAPDTMNTIAATSTPEEGTPDWLALRSATTKKTTNNDEENNDDSVKEEYDSAGTPTPTKKKCGVASVVVTGLSLLSMLVFGYATVVQANDNDPIYWIVFYGLHVVIPCLFLVIYHSPGRKKKTVTTLHLLNSVVFSWSLVIVALTLVELRDVASGDDMNATTNSSNATMSPTAELREELSFEMGGAGLGAINALYHSLILLCCCPRAGDGSASHPADKNSTAKEDGSASAIPSLGTIQ